MITPVSNGGIFDELINSDRFEERFTGDAELTNSTATEATADRYVLQAGAIFKLFALFSKFKSLNVFSLLISKLIEILITPRYIYYRDLR